MIAMANKIDPVQEDADVLGVKETHPCYGMIGLNRQTHPGGTILFGSSIPHSNVFSLTIRPASKYRNLNSDRYYGERNPHIEVLISGTQLIDLITSPNMGDGIPCTIHRLNGEKIDDCPDTNQRKKFEDEFDATVKEATQQAMELEVQIAELLERKGTIKKADKEELRRMVGAVVSKLRSTVPFIQSQFNEAIDRTVTEAKGEVEGFFTSKVEALGLEALKDQLEQFLLPHVDDQGKLEGPNETPDEES